MIEMIPKLAMLAQAGDPDSIPGALMEVKYDGHRMFAFTRANGVHMYARSAVDKTGKLPAIERWLFDNVPVGCVLDGEVIADNAAGGDWAGVQTILGASSKTSTALTYVVFDILECMGEDVRSSTLATRRGMLEMIFGRADDSEPQPVRLSVQMEYSAEHVASLIANGFEGAIIKDPNGRYRSGKRDWVKIKATETEDVVVMGATAGKGRFEGQIGALRFGQYEPVVTNTPPHIVLVEKGQCSGMDDEMRLMLSGLDESDLVGTVIEVQHMGKMPSGGWRHPQFKRIRTDKLPQECVA